ncbi:MAG: hypothetical protein AAFR28_05720 [Pseudomonadota bacterium]
MTRANLTCADLRPADLPACSRDLIAGARSRRAARISRNGSEDLRRRP